MSYQVEVVLANGQKYTPHGGDIFVRYSPDRTHWSTWQVLQYGEPQTAEEKETPGLYFTGTIRVPNVEREKFNELLREYSRLDVPWKSDEDAAVRWILKEHDPDFFEKHLPFIGYLELRFEGSFRGGQRIRSLSADISYAMGGIHSPPKDGEAYRDRDSKPWSFRADEKEK